MEYRRSVHELLLHKKTAHKTVRGNIIPHDVALRVAIGKSSKKAIRSTRDSRDIDGRKSTVLQQKAVRVEIGIAESPHDVALENRES
jgi:hypothetical protein